MVRYKVNSGKNLVNIIIKIRQNASSTEKLKHAVAINVGVTVKSGAI